MLSFSLLSFWTGGHFAQAQDAPPIFRVQSSLIPVYVNATDAHGAPIAGLTRDDFSISEDGRAQKIAIFEKESEQPLSIVLALDTSGSVRKDRTAEEQTALRFLKATVRPVDRVELLEFSEGVREAVPFTNDVKALERGLQAMHSGYATAVYDALTMAAQKLQPLHGRKIVVIVSDGADTSRRGNYQAALKAVIGAEASVYSLIDVPVDADAGREVGGEHALITLSEDSGGKYYYGGDAAHLDAAFQQLSSDLRTQYLLGYYAPNRGGNADYRAIAVSVHRAPAEPRVFLRYRPGYYPRPAGNASTQP